MKTTDPQGKRALFEAGPVEGRPEPRVEGRKALFSTATPLSGTVVVECSTCGEHKRVGLCEVIARILRISLWVPPLEYNRWMRCPSCERRAWCRVGWLD